MAFRVIAVPEGQQNCGAEDHQDEAGAEGELNDDKEGCRERTSLYEKVTVLTRWRNLG